MLFKPERNKSHRFIYAKVRVHKVYLTIIIYWYHYNTHIQSISAVAWADNSDGSTKHYWVGLPMTKESLFKLFTYFGCFVSCLVGIAC